MSREQFENWFTGSQNIKLDVDKQGNYFYSQAYSAWVTWQACQTLNDTRIAELNIEAQIEAYEKGFIDGVISCTNKVKKEATE